MSNTDSKSDDRQVARHQLTRADAEQLVKGAPTGSEFVIDLKLNVPLESGGTHSITSYADISRQEAARLVTRMLTDAAEQAGARIPMTTYFHREHGGRKVRCVFWIG